MNEMYNMSIVTHYYGVIGVFGVIFVNVFMLLRANNIYAYRRFMTLFMPIGSIGIGTVIFTGVIMMAAKHLDFTIENIIMIVFSVAMIVLEAKRSSKLKYLNSKKEDALSEYKKFAFNILKIEFIGTLIISVWMLI